MCNVSKDKEAGRARSPQLILNTVASHVLMIIVGYGAATFVAEWPSPSAAATESKPAVRKPAPREVYDRLTGELTGLERAAERLRVEIRDAENLEILHQRHGYGPETRAYRQNESRCRACREELEETERIIAQVSKIEDRMRNLLAEATARSGAEHNADAIQEALKMMAQLEARSSRTGVISWPDEVVRSIGLAAKGAQVPSTQEFLTMKAMELKQIANLPPEFVERLASRWITTAEQLVAAAAQPSGLQRLAEHVRMPAGEVARLVDVVRATLPAPRATEMEQPPCVDRGMGVIFPDAPTEGNHGSH